MYWDNPGKENTSGTVKVAASAAVSRGVKDMVVASNTGETALALRDALCAEAGGSFEAINVVCVTHHVGFQRPGHDEMGPEMRKRLGDMGFKLLTTTHLFRGVETGITKAFGGLYPAGMIAQTLRMLGHGTKVCVEISVMALDAGLIPYGEPVIAIGGTGRGADTALLLMPAHSNSLFDTEILEVLCKPRYPKRNPGA